MVAIYDVLKASKGIHVDDTFAELWGRKLSNAYTVATYTGTLPATLTGTKAGYLESYKIYGNAVQNGTPTPENPIIPSGCGERTENLANDSVSKNYTIDDTTGQPIPATSTTMKYWCMTQPINVMSGDTICLSVVNYSRTMFWKYTIDDGNENVLSKSSGLTNGDIIHIRATGFMRIAIYVYNASETYMDDAIDSLMLTEGSTPPTSYIPYGYKLPILSNSTVTDIYIGNAPLAKDEYVDSTTGKIYRRTKNLSPPKEEWTDEWIWGDGTVHPSTEIKVSPFIDVSTCETCIMEVFFTETAWAAAGFREMAFYDENKQYLGWIGGGGRQALTPKSSESLSEFPAGTVYVRIGCSHGDQLFYPQLVSGYTPTHQFYPYLIPTDPPASFPQIPTFAGTTTIDYNGEPKPDKVELTYKKRKGQ